MKILFDHLFYRIITHIFSRLFYEFQVPVQTLTAVLNLLQATRGRIQAFHQAYQTAQQQHPNHHLNPHFTFKQKDKTNYSFNSKALVQPKKNRK